MDKNAKKKKDPTGSANPQRSDNKGKSDQLMGTLPSATQSVSARSGKGANAAKTNRGGRGS